MEGGKIICLDSTFIIDFLRGKKEAFSAYEKLKNEKLFITEISIFEIFDGIFTKKSKKEFDKFFEFSEHVEIIPAKSMFALDAAKFRHDLRKKGMIIDDMDLLIVGMMFNFGIKKIVTKNKKHFSKFDGIEVISY